MNESVIRTAFDNIASHISNIDKIRTLVEKLESENPSTSTIIEVLQRELEDAEVTLRTDIRILINECRHLESGKKGK
jgi:hypothetical protein